MAGAALLYVGADGLVRGSANLARRWRLTPLAIGLTVVSFGTSTPELVVSVDAAITGSAAIAVGNVVGSNICNIALILGLSAVLCPLAVNARLVRVDIPLMVLISLVIIVMLGDESIGRVEGLLLMGGLMLYTGGSLRAARRTPQVRAVGPLPEPLGTGRSVVY